MDFALRDSYTLPDLLAIMALLRSENGCPWDLAQTHRSIRQNVIEEAYEVADAIDRESAADLCEELGDLLLQVVFHSRMAQEAGAFTFDDVADGICKKLIGRHPHIFGDRKVGSAQEMLALWDAVKAEEKGQKTASETLRAVPVSFPALMRAQKLCSRSARAGVLPEDPAGAMRAVLDRLQTGEKVDGAELGSLLFSAAALCQTLGADAEQVLAAACGRYVDAFAQTERMAAEAGIPLSQAAEAQKRIWRTSVDEIEKKQEKKKTEEQQA